MDHSTNLLLSGFLRKSELNYDIIIPKDIFETINSYFLSYLIFGVGGIIMVNLVLAKN